MERPSASRRRDRTVWRPATCRVIDLLVRGGANPAARNQRGETALHLAARTDRHGRCRPTDRRRRARLDAENAIQATPLHEAVADAGRADLVTLLLKAGASAGRKDARGMTPLHWMSRFASTRIHPASRPVQALARLLVDAGAKVDEPDAADRTPLYHAVAQGNYGAAEFLLAHGANANRPARGGVTPLHLATYLDDARFAELLLARGADVSARDAAGRTALHWAAFFGRTTVLPKLIDSRADPSAKDRRSRTPFDWAVAGCAREAARLLAGARSGDLGKARFDSCPALVDGKAHEEGSALHRAVASRDLDAARALIAAGAKPNATDSERRTPLHILAASRTGTGQMIQVAEILVNAGADLRAVDWHGRTPLQSTCDDADSDEGHEIVTEYLICKGADAAVSDQFGWTAADIAVIRGWPDPKALQCAGHGRDYAIANDHSERDRPRLMY